MDVSTATPLELGQEPPRDLSFQAIFETEYGYVRLSVRRLGVEERDRDDAVHDVFLVVYRKLSDLDPSRPLRPWLFGIAYRVVLGQKRRFATSREKLAHGESPDVADAGPPADEQLEIEERKQMVCEALDSLDDEKRAVFILHDLDEVPMPEIARALEIPTNTAYSRLRLARVAFKHALERVLARRRTRRGGPS